MYKYLALLALAVFLGMAGYLRGLRPGIVRAQLTYSEAAFRQVISQWSEDGRRRFQAHFPADYVFIGLYSTAGWLFGQAQSGSAAGSLWVGVATLALPLAGVADIAENLWHQRFLRARPGTLPSLSFLLAGIAATIKYALFLAFAWACLVVSSSSAA